MIIQDDRFDSTGTKTICALTTSATDAPLRRLPVSPNECNGLRSLSHLMVDKVATVPKSKLGRRLGLLNEADNVRLDRAILIFPGLMLGDQAE